MERETPKQNVADEVQAVAELWDKLYEAGQDRKPAVEAFKALSQPQQVALWSVLTRPPFLPTFSNATPCGSVVARDDEYAKAKVIHADFVHHILAAFTAEGPLTDHASVDRAMKRLEVPTTWKRP